MEQGDETMARMTSARQGSVQQHRSMPQVTTNQPNVQPAPTAVVTEANLPPTGRKKRKPNANGNSVALRIMAHQT
ncbi:hypothetical protein P8452_46195 [Trifolium repens]|nr:hypothetical protein P8452_46195 [Trifolium repens]